MKWWSSGDSCGNIRVSVGPSCSLQSHNRGLRIDDQSVVGELAPVGPLPTIVIEPAPRWPGINMRAMWANRELFMFLVWRDLVKSGSTRRLRWAQDGRCCSHS